MPGHEPSGLEHVVGHFGATVGVAVGVGPLDVAVGVGPPAVGVAVGPLTLAAGGIVTLTASSLSTGVGVPIGTTEGEGTAICAVCTS